MTTLLITLIPIAYALGYITSAILAAGKHADLQQQNQRLRWHISKIIQEAQTGQITEKTLQNAHQTLSDQ